MPTQNEQKPIVRVSYNDMEAYLMLPEPPEGEEYTAAMLMDALEEKGVSEGIDHRKIQEMVSQKLYNTEFKIAAGIAPTDGVDGYYDYNFDTNFDSKPKVLPDGSVDYWSVHSIDCDIPSGRRGNRRRDGEGQSPAGKARERADADQGQGLCAPG